MKKENWTLLLSIFAFGLSAYAALACDKRIEADWMGILVGILALLVTTLLGWNIYSAIHIEEIINRKITSAIDLAEEKAQRSIKINLATAQIRTLTGYIANRDWYMAMQGFSTCIWDILQLQDKRMAGDIIPIIKDCLDMIPMDNTKYTRAIKMLADNIKKLSVLDERACDLYVKAVEMLPPKDS